ncbi:F-box domain containing protein [Pandoravirus quercus]|uniref:F-box domain containing protein n=2 Tax=Pandoravirus TaxID=2060084 RepID=A0A2U7U9D6_9VIRU|nr:F-box domain containing protein [Pandoravirus quercus]AVK74990.1 F-box domain containing protein [Pandoravirus quercus]QBZ81178.1 F-box domain containing protein [Pandoravirus celtis]
MQTGPTTVVANATIVRSQMDRVTTGPRGVLREATRKRRPTGDPVDAVTRPYQRRRTGRAPPPPTLASLPAELLVAVGLWLDPVDLVHVGATCRRLAEIAADQPLWHGVFERLYAPALYRGNAAGALAHYDEPTGGAPHTGAPPLPFAHMDVVGRDWRWLCLVHWIHHRSTPESPSLEPLESLESLGSLPLPSPPGESTMRYMSPPGAVHADYMVEIRRDTAGRLVGWVEAIWTRTDETLQPKTVLARGDSNTRFVTDPAAVADALATADAKAPTHGRIITRAGRTLYKGACRRGLAHGQGIVTDMAGRRWESVSRDGTTLSTTLRPDDGRVREIIVRCVAAPRPHNDPQRPPRPAEARGTRRHTSAALTVRYANGDQLHMLHTAHAKAALFWCSPDCPDLRFAARRIECRSWAQALDIDAIALWPLDEPGDEPDDHARLFADYVRSGHCGWGPEAQRHAERMDALGAHALLDGRVPSDVPYAIVRSDDAQVAAARFFFETYP